MRADTEHLQLVARFCCCDPFHKSRASGKEQREAKGIYTPTMAHSCVPFQGGWLQPSTAKSQMRLTRGSMCSLSEKPAT